MENRKERVERGSGNVFADLERPDAQTQLVKAELVSRIDAVVRRRRMTQVQAAALLGLSQPDVSRLLRGNFREYSVDRLLRLLMLLGSDVQIVIREPRAHHQGTLSVEAASLRTSRQHV